MQGGSKNLSAAKQETVDLSKFLYMSKSEACELHQVTYMSNVITFLNKLRQSRVGPSGQITKLTTLLNAITMAISKVPDKNVSEADERMVVRAKVVETKIRALQKSL